MKAVGAPRGLHKGAPRAPVHGYVAKRAVLPPMAVWQGAGRSQSPPTQQTKPAADALTDGRLGLGFSAGGLLFPYFLGVTKHLRETGVLTDDTPVAGASAGSLIAACCKSGLTHEQLMEATMDLAAECRRRGTKHNLGPILEDSLQRLLPNDMHERANAGNVHIAVTALVPRVRPVLVNRFSSKDDVIAALLTSCHIPWYLDGNLLTTFRGAPHCDGGLTDFIPRPTGVDCTVRVCCFPSQQFKALGPLCITPDTFEAWPHDLRTMLGWAFQPADDEMLVALADKGARDAAAWAQAAGVDTPAPGVLAAPTERVVL